ncbi:MAG: serine hydrolase, partial [Cellvibrionales bacterium]|nr:serine hydrolase [Cellvibrionales bacterium]
LNLMNMTSGIYSYTENLSYRAELAKNDGKIHYLTDNDLIRLAMEKLRYFAPGQGWHYSDTAYLILGKCIQAISGRTPRQTLEQRLIAPAYPKLSNTTFFKSKTTDLVPGFSIDNKSFDTPIALGSLAREIYSTTEDMANWFAMLLSGEILNKDAMKKLTTLYSKKTGRPVSADATGYSLALDHTTTACGSLWYYPGGSRGYSTFALWLPTLGTSIAFAMNKEADFWRILSDFLHLINCPLNES